MTVAMLATDVIAQLRSDEFARLDDVGIAYLDYTGAAVYPDSLVRAHTDLLTTRLFGNPHADNAPSRLSSNTLARVRSRVLAFFRADPGEYDVIFTANATGAVQHVAAGFPFQPRSRLVLTADNHNSVNGMREYAARAGADVTYVPLDAELRAPPPDAFLSPVSGPSLFAYPAQSNFSGVRHPLSWIETAQMRGYRVLVDAAAFAASGALRLDEVQPDFVCLSCYKLFGYPTGVGLLIARHDALAMLRRPWFSGGTVQFVSVQNRLHRMRVDAERFEDGTPDFLGIAAVERGFDFMDSVGLARIGRHVAALTARLLAGMARINHDARAARICVYGPRDLNARGGTIAFNVLRHEGGVVPYEDVVSTAAVHGIAVRGGCFCNPGAAEHAFGLDADRMSVCLKQEPFEVAALRTCCDGAAVGAVRVSVGLANNERDVDRLLQFLRTM